MVQFVPSHRPTPTPIAIDGDAEVRITVRVPPDSTTVNGLTSRLFACTVPAKFSTVGFVGVVGIVVFVVGSSVVHAGAHARTHNRSGRARLIDPIVQSFWMIQLSNLTKSYGDRVLLDEVTWQIT